MVINLDLSPYCVDISWSYPIGLCLDGRQLPELILIACHLLSRVPFDGGDERDASLDLECKPLQLGTCLVSEFI